MNMNRLRVNDSRGRRWPNFKTPSAARALYVVVTIAVVSCATAPIGKKDLLDFLQVGQTTRQDVCSHLGDPSEQYEGSRIATCRLDEDEGGLFLVR